MEGSNNWVVTFALYYKNDSLGEVKQMVFEDNFLTVRVHNQNQISAPDMIYCFDMSSWRADYDGYIFPPSV